MTSLLYRSKLKIFWHIKETSGDINQACTNLISESPLRPGVEVTRLGLPRGFRGVLSSLLSRLKRLGVIWDKKKNDKSAHIILLRTCMCSWACFAREFYGTCDGERPVSFCDVRFPSTNPKLALPWFVFNAKKITKKWHVTCVQDQTAQ